MNVRDQLAALVDPTGGGTYATVQNFVYSGNSVILVYNGSSALTDRLLVIPPLSKGMPGGVGATAGEATERALVDENGSGTVSWFLKNREGDTIDVVQYKSGTDTTTVVNHVIYSAFGNITSQSHFGLYIWNEIDPSKWILLNVGSGRNPIGTPRLVLIGLSD